MLKKIYLREEKNILNIVAQNFSREHFTSHPWFELSFYAIYKGTIAIFKHQIDLMKINENWDHHTIYDDWVTPR